jgi:hypothetical protein
MNGAAKHFSAMFHMCRENRNIIMHSAAALEDDNRIRTLIKSSNSGRQISFPFDIKTVWAEANQCTAAESYLFGILLYADTMFTNNGEPKTLPEKPPLQNKLAPLESQ